MPLARIAGRWTETDEEGRPLDPAAVLRRIQRRAERLAGRGSAYNIGVITAATDPEAIKRAAAKAREDLAEAKQRLLILASKKLGAWSSEPLAGKNPLEGTGLEKTRHAQAESWVNLLHARAAGDTGLAIRAVRELRNAIQLEMEARGEIASRSSVQAVQVTVNQGSDDETRARLQREAEADPLVGAALARAFGLELKTEPEPEPEPIEATATRQPTSGELRAELEKARRENAQLRESLALGARAGRGGLAGEDTGEPPEDE